MANKNINKVDIIASDVKSYPDAKSTAFVFVHTNIAM